MLKRRTLIVIGDAYRVHPHATFALAISIG